MDKLTEARTRLLVVYDGRCGFCNSSVRWLLKHDRNDRLRFAPFESPKVAALLARGEFSATGRQSDALGTGTPGSLLVVKWFEQSSDADGSSGANQKRERELMRSEAVLALLAELPQPWPALGGMLRLVPRPLRDLGYRLVARMRYRIGGRLASCPLPTLEERARFF